MYFFKFNKNKLVKNIKKYIVADDTLKEWFSNYSFLFNNKNI